MSYNESVLKKLLDLIPQTGKLEWIGIRPGKKQALTELKSVRIEQDSGLEGDRFRGSVSGKRQVTLIQQEHLQVVANILGKSEIDPGWTRRNLVVSGINLLSLKHQSFQIGEAVLQTTGICAPCSRMEENLGPGGYNAMRGHGGITAKVLQAGEIQIGDPVRLLLQRLKVADSSWAHTSCLDMKLHLRVEIR